VPPMPSSMLRYPFWTRVCVGFLIVVGGVSPGAAAGSVPLEWRWDQGTRTAYTITERMDQSISGVVEARIRWTREIGYTDEVVTVSGDGAVVRRSYEHVVVEAEQGGPGQASSGTVRYDTRSPPADPRVAQHVMVAPFIALAGHAIEFTVDDQGRVSGVMGSETALDAMFTAIMGPSMPGPMRAGLTGFVGQGSREDLLAEQLRQGFRVIPGRGVSLRESWEIPIEHVSPLAGSLESLTVGTLRRFDRRRHAAEIGLEGTLSLGQDGEAGLLGLTGISLESGTIEGEVVFDTRDRAIERSDMTMRTVWVMGESESTGVTSGLRQVIEQRATLERGRGASARPRP
jgi:hypothetical protein